MIKQASLVPDSSTEWGDFIISELIARLPELASRISNFQILKDDKAGNALSLVSLENSRVFIPAVIKDWELLPTDVFIYRQGTEFKFCYISRRSLTQLIISPSIGNVLSSFGSGYSDSFLNLFSPYAGNSNFGADVPTFSNTKAASINALLDKYDLGMYKLPVHETKQASIPTYFLAYRSLEGVDLYYPDSNIPEKLAHSSFVEAVKDLPDSYEKLANMWNGDVVAFGYPAIREGNIKFENENKSYKVDMPATEGVYDIGTSSVYINPEVKYLDGSKCGYALGVTLGAYSLSKSYYGFKLPVMGEGSNLSREEFLRESKKPVSGKIYTLYNDITKEVTVPFRLISSYVNEINKLVFKVIPVIGDKATYTLIFHDINEGPVKIGDFKYVYPEIYSRLCELPDNLKDSLTAECNLGNRVYVHVTYSNGMYTIEENGVTEFPVDKGKFVHTLTRRYGFSLGQSDAFLEALNRELRKGFTVPCRLDELRAAIYKEDTDIPVTDMQKEALKLASRISKVKYAGPPPVQEPQGNNAQARESQNNTRLGGSSLLQTLMTVSPLENNTKEIVDMLKFYFTTGRQEDYIRLMGSIKSKLKNVESDICKLMVLVQFVNIPGQSYEDLRMLASDIDTYLYRLDSSMVILDDKISKT